jgi:hypothetical protein
MCPYKDRLAIMVVDTKEKVLVRKDCIDFDYTPLHLEGSGGI